MSRTTRNHVPQDRYDASALLQTLAETGRESLAAMDDGMLQQAQMGLQAMSRQLAARARWLEASLQQRHLALADRFQQQALRLPASKTASEAGQLHPAAASLPAWPVARVEPQVWPAAAQAILSTDTTPTAARPAQPGAVSPIDPGAIADGGPATLDEVIGAVRFKQLLKACFVYPFRNPERAALYRLPGSGGVLVYGPPGTGKTFVIRALARELGVPVYLVSPSQILSKWLGESEKQLSALFEQARQHPAALIFIDEIDALAPCRDSLGDNGGALQRLQTQLLTELDGFARHRGCLLFVGATNRPWALDRALLRPGRFDAIAYLGLPQASTRALLLRQTLVGVPQQADLGWDKAAVLLQGCSAAETVASATQAARLAFADAVRTGNNRPVTNADLIAAARSAHRAATPALLERYADFAAEHGLPPPEDDASPAAGAVAPPLAVAGDNGCAAFEPFRFVKARDLSIDVETLPFMCYALQHAGIAPIRQLTLVNQGAEESQNLLVEVALVPDEYGEPWRINIAELPAGQRWESGPISLPLRLDRLRAVNEKERAHLRITVRDKDEVLLARTQELPVLAYNEWVYLPKFLQLAAAYVQPNSAALHPVVQAAARRLQAAMGSSAFPGYQRGDRDHVEQMLLAVHGALANDILLAYINPPPSFEVSGQKIRLVADTLAQGRGTCLDLAILQLALWEHVGLHPVLVLVPGHAFVGCWMDERTAPEPVVVLRPRAGGRSAKAIEQALNYGALRVFNSVEITNGQSLHDAERKALEILRQTLEQGGDVQWVDVRACRASVTPLP